MTTVLGRHDELGEIAAFLDAVAVDGSGVVLLSGQAGIGKTTIWEAAARAAEERGFRVVSSRPTEVETGLAFAALGDLLGPLLDADHPDLPAPQREALEAALLRGSASSPPQPLGVALAVLHVLQAAAARQPLMLAIDDIGWLDEPSVRALGFAIRRLDREPIAVLIARRAATTHEPLPTWLAEVPPARMTRIDVRPLSIDAIDGLLRDRLGLALTRPLVARLHAISGGTPFYALELGREVQARGVPAATESLTVPRSLDDLIGARFAALEPAAAEVALHAAALSHPSGSMLAAAIGAERTSDGVDGARAAGLIDTSDDRIRFTHPLLAAAAYGRATADQRREAHRRLAEVVTDAEERARHLARAVVEPDGSVARAIEEGADAAARRGAPDAAAGLVAEAARLTPADAPDDRHRRRAAAAEHLIVAGDIARADAILAGVATDLPDGPAKARILARRGYLALVLGAVDGAEALLLEGMGMATGDDRVRAEIHSLLAGVAFLSWRDWRRARSHAFTALGLAHAAGDRALELQLLGHAASWLRTLGRPWRSMLERADALEAAMSEVERDEVPTLEHPDLQFARNLVAEGDIDEARRRLGRLVDDARSSGDWMSLPRLLSVLAEVEFEAGAWDLAEQLAEDAAIGLRQTGEGAFIFNIRLTTLGMRVAQGQVEAARALAEEIGPLAAESSSRWVHDAIPLLLATLDLSLGDAAAAYERSAPVMGRPGLGRLATVRWESIVGLHVEALVGLGRTDEARCILDPAERRARRRAVPVGLAELRRVRALVLAADGAYPAAVAAAEEAVAILAARQAPLRTARAWFTLGEVLRRSRQKSASRRAFQAALELFERIGARVWVERARTELGRVATRRPEGSSLTETERRVAELAAGGQTNREIAAELFMSVHTVEAHLTRVFRALGVHTRTELHRVVLDADVRDGEAEPTAQT